MEIFANVPSPDPTNISPFGSNEMHQTPYENNFLIGPNLLKIALSILIFLKIIFNVFLKQNTSITSPVLVPT